MAGEEVLVRDLAIVMIAAAAASVAFQRFGQPAVLGHLLAGVAIGPYVFRTPLIADPTNIRTLAEIGTIFLLFSLGLNFHLAKLRRVGSPAVVAAVLGLALMIGFATLASRVLGWSGMDAIFLGVVLALSGAAVIVKVLEDMGRGDAPTTQVVYGILVVEKLVAVLILALLSSLAATGTFEFAELAGLGARIALFVLVTLVLGILLVPRLVDGVARMRAPDTLVILVLGVVFGMAMVGSRLGLGLGLGAFIAGAVVAEASARASVSTRIAPLRDVFVSVFFVSMGLLVDPAQILAYWWQILALSAVVIFGKFAMVGFASFVAGYPARQSFEIGISTAMLGGFGLVLASLGQEVGVTGDFLFPVVAAVTAVTAFVTPLLVQRADRIVAATATGVPDHVRAWSRTYTRWLGRHRRSLAQVELARAAPRHATRLAAYAALLVVLVLALGVALDRVGRVQAGRPFGENALVVGAWVGFVLLALPLGFGLARAVRALVRALLDALVPPTVQDRPGRVVVTVVRNTLYAAAAILAGAIAAAAGGPFLPPLPLLAVIVLFAAGTAYFLRASLRAFDRQMDETVDTILRDGSPESRDEVLSLIRERYGGSVDLETLVVPEGSVLANRRIRDAALPHRTGATLVTHEREGLRTVNPPPDTVLLPGDVVGILGSAEEVEATRRLAREREPVPRLGRRHADVRIEEVPVSRASPVAGVPIAESRIREQTGATVLALLRGGASVPSPAPETLLRPGDVLVVLGSPEQVEAARALLTREPDASGT